MKTSLKFDIDWFDAPVPLRPTPAAPPEPKPADHPCLTCRYLKRSIMARAPTYWQCTFCGGYCKTERSASGTCGPLGHYWQEADVIETPTERWLGKLYQLFRKLTHVE